MTNDAERNGAILSQLAQALAGKEGVSLILSESATETPGETKAKPKRGARGGAVPGTGRWYLLRRLRRDRPDIWERCLRDELSLHAGAIEAGIIRRVPAEEAGLERLVVAWAKAGLEDRVAFLFLVEEEIEAAYDGELRNDIAPPPARGKGPRPFRLRDRAKGVPDIETLIDRGRSTSGLARELGVSYRTLCRWRFGHTKPSQTHKDKLAQLVAELEDEPRQAG